MQIDNQGGNYPMGSNDVINRAGNLIQGKSLTLLNEGEHGIYQQRWMNYLTWRNSRKELKMLFTNSGSLSFSRKYTFHGINLLLKKRSVIYTVNKALPSECEWYLV